MRSLTQSTVSLACFVIHQSDHKSVKSSLTSADTSGMSTQLAPFERKTYQPDRIFNMATAMRELLEARDLRLIEAQSV